MQIEISINTSHFMFQANPEKETAHLLKTIGNLLKETSEDYVSLKSSCAGYTLGECVVKDRDTPEFEYVSKSGKYCPHCGSDDMTCSDTKDDNSGCLSRIVTCDACDNTRKEVFSLTECVL